MKRKRVLRAVLAALAGLLLLAGLLAWRLVPSYASALRLNWGISLPILARPSLCYEADSGPSFHGDGIRYHVFSYQYEDPVSLMFAWGSVERETIYCDSYREAAEAVERETIYCDSYREAAEAWLDKIQVSAGDRPDYGGCLYWYRAQEDNSELLVFWDAEQNRLYFLESFL